MAQEQQNFDSFEQLVQHFQDHVNEPGFQDILNGVLNKLTSNEAQNAYVAFVNQSRKLLVKEAQITPDDIFQFVELIRTLNQSVYQHHPELSAAGADISVAQLDTLFRFILKESTEKVNTVTIRIKNLMEEAEASWNNNILNFLVNIILATNQGTVDEHQPYKNHDHLNRLRETLSDLTQMVSTDSSETARKLYYQFIKHYDVIEAKIRAGNNDITDEVAKIESLLSDQRESTVKNHPEYKMLIESYQHIGNRKEHDSILNKFLVALAALSEESDLRELRKYAFCLLNELNNTVSQLPSVDDLDNQKILEQYQKSYSSILALTNGNYTHEQLTLLFEFIEVLEKNPPEYFTAMRGLIQKMDNELPKLFKPTKAYEVNLGKLPESLQNIHRHVQQSLNEPNKTAEQKKLTIELLMVFVVGIVGDSAQYLNNNDLNQLFLEPIRRIISDESAQPENELIKKVRQEIYHHNFEKLPKVYHYIHKSIDLLTEKNPDIAKTYKDELYNLLSCGFITFNDEFANKLNGIVKPILEKHAEQSELFSENYGSFYYDGLVNCGDNTFWKEATSAKNDLRILLKQHPLARKWTIRALNDEWKFTIPNIAVENEQAIQRLLQKRFWNKFERSRTQDDYQGKIGTFIHLYKENHMGIFDLYHHGKECIKSLREETRWWQFVRRFRIARFDNLLTNTLPKTVTIKQNDTPVKPDQNSYSNLLDTLVEAKVAIDKSHGSTSKIDDLSSNVIDQEKRRFQSVKQVNTFFFKAHHYISREKEHGAKITFKKDP